MSAKTYTIRRWVVWGFLIVWFIPSMLRMPWTIDWFADHLRMLP